MNEIAPTPEEMTEGQIELWEGAFLRFRQRRMQHLKMIGGTAALFPILVLPMTVWLGVPLLTKPLTAKTYFVCWFLAAPFVALIYLRVLMRFEQGYRRDKDGERYEFSYHHRGGDIRESFRNLAEGTLNDITSSRGGCFTNITVLFIAGMLALAVLAIPGIFYVASVFLAFFAALKILGWYLWFEPVEGMRRAIFKAKEEREARMIHVRGAKVIEVPDASASSPANPPG